MRRYLYAVVVIFALMAVVPLHAQMPSRDASASGNRFLEICSVFEKADRKERLTDNEVNDVAYCTGFIMGLRDGIGITTAMLKHFDDSMKGSAEDLAICFPDNVEIGQIIRITLKYIREHPEQAHLSSAELVVLAEFYAFPCAAPTPAPKEKR